MKLTQRVAVAIDYSCLPIAHADDALWPKLIQRTQDAHAPTGARSAALGLACQSDNPANAAQVLDVAVDWVQQIDQSGLAAEQIARDPVLSPIRELIRALACDDGARLSAAGDASSLLDLWTLIATRPWTSRETKEAAFSLIATSGGPALAAVDIGPRRLWPPGSLGAADGGKLPAGFFPNRRLCSPVPVVQCRRSG